MEAGKYLALAAVLGILTPLRALAQHPGSATDSTASWAQKMARYMFGGPGSIYRDPKPLKIEGSVQWRPREESPPGYSGTLKATNQWGTVGILTATRDHEEGEAVTDYAGGFRVLPFLWIPYLKEVPDLLDVKAGGNWRKRSLERGLGGYATFRFAPESSHYLKLGLAYEESRDKEGLRERATIVDFQHKLTELIKTFAHPWGIFRTWSWSAFTGPSMTRRPSPTEAGLRERPNGNLNTFAAWAASFPFRITT